MRSAFLIVVAAATLAQTAGLARTAGLKSRATYYPSENVARDFSPAPNAQAATGTVMGQVTLTTAKSSPLAATAYQRRSVSQKPAPSGPESRNVVIYVSGLKPPTPPAPMRATIAQRLEQFLPQVTAVTVGSTIDFPNQDPFFHNVFSLSKAATFDLGKYQTNATRPHLFTKPGIVKVFCHIHSQMSALVMVLDHPWFTIPAADGTFTLPPVPAGELTVVAWHDRIGERREKVTLRAGETMKLSFTLPVLDPQP